MLHIQVVEQQRQPLQRAICQTEEQIMGKNSQPKGTKVLSMELL